VEEKKSQIPEKLKPAFEIFMDELEKHLGVLNTSLKEVEQLMNDASERGRMANRFHTIKGGASFFQLSNISDPADRGEKMLQQNATELEMDNVSEELMSIIHALQVQADALRAEVEDS